MRMRDYAAEADRARVMPVKRWQCAECGKVVKAKRRPPCEKCRTPMKEVRE